MKANNNKSLFTLWTISAVMLALIVLLANGCRSKQLAHDAAGSFEADEVMVSAQESGLLIDFSVQEGTRLAKDSLVGRIDPVPLELQAAQTTARMDALEERVVDLTPQLQVLKQQLAVQETQLANLRREENRIEQLVAADAATGKQLDDIRYQIQTLLKQRQVTQSQLALQQSATSTTNRTIRSERPVLEKSAAQIQDRIARTQIRNPLDGTVLTTYALAGEMTSAGRVLYKIANLDHLYLRAFITGDQLSRVKLGQAVQVFVDSAAGRFKSYPGTMVWISDKAEFTPKTIQTKEERQHLVYAVKVRVKNDGFLKIGMYGELGL